MDPQVRTAAYPLNVRMLPESAHTVVQTLFLIVGALGLLGALVCWLWWKKLVKKMRARHAAENAELEHKTRVYRYMLSQGHHMPWLLKDYPPC